MKIAKHKILLLLLALFCLLHTGCGEPEEPIEPDTENEIPRVDVTQIGAAGYVAMDGYLLDSTEAAVENYTVTIYYNGAIVLEATTNAYGYFSLPQFPIIAGLNVSITDSEGGQVTDSLLSLATGEELVNNGVAGALSLTVPEGLEQIYMMLQIDNGQLNIFALYD